MNGIGNDYLFVNCLEQDYKDVDWPKLARKYSNRKTGIGSDGIILITSSKKADFGMRIFNADGSDGEMCGNGIRCVAKYIYDRKISKKKILKIETVVGIKTTQIKSLKKNSVHMVTVDMGTPTIKSTKIKVGSKMFEVILVNVGNPHCIVFVDDYDFDYRALGKKIEHHKMFSPRKTNVEFIRANRKNDITMRVWERGSGETQACGTGATASVAATAYLKKTDRKVTVHLLGGDLEIEWKKNNHLFMTGPAEEEFSGEFKTSYP